MAIKSNISIDQGADFSTTIEIKDSNGVAVDITGYSANATLRKTYYSSNSYAFQTTVDGPNGRVTLSLPASNTAVLSAGRFVYDLVVTNVALVKSRVVEGYVTVCPGVTRSGNTYII